MTQRPTKASVGSGDMHIPKILEKPEAQGYNGSGITELFMSNDLASKMLIVNSPHERN